MSERVLPDSGAVSLDTPAFVYLIERHPRYHAASDRIFEQISVGGARGIASTLIFPELLVPYYRHDEAGRATAIVSAIRRLPNLVVTDVTQDGAVNAARLRSIYNLRTPDAVHVATALEHRADWFVTNDRRLKRVEPEGIRVWLFDEHLEANS